MVDKDDNFEIQEVEDYYGGKPGEAFSQSALVMSAIRKSVEAGSEEMKEGYWNTKFDKLGNAHRIWIPDSRKVFIETIESVEMIIDRDLDKDAVAELKILKEWLKKRLDIYIASEEKDWETAHITLKKQWMEGGSYFRKGFLSKGLPYSHEYIEDQVKVAREKIKTFTRLIKRLGDYKEETYMA